jgi:signal transduction histidine kinase
MVGLANRPGGYSETALAFLQPLVTTCATLIEALRSERQRREEEARLAAALDRSELTLWDWDIRDDTIYGFAGGGGWMPEGRVPATRWLKRVHPLDRDAVRAAFEAHARGETDRLEVEHRYVAPGGTVGWVLTRGRVIERGPGGWPLRAAGSFLDITRRKEAELERERLELQVRQAQKLESLGVLAGGIAHDFNNLLAAVLGNLYLLRQALPPDPALHELADDARHAAERGAELVKRLLAFGRPEVGRPEPVDLDRLIAEAAALARPMVEPRARLVVRPARGEAWVLGSATALEQILVNLFVNARDAMPDGGAITVSRSIIELGARRRWAPPELPRGRYHVIAVSDTGVGMPREILEKIFDPFFTTKPVGRGTGLGLSTALAIARAHGGWLSAESTPGRGSTFRLLLPVADDRPGR